MALKHTRKNAKPKHSNSPQEQMQDAGQQAMIAPPVPSVTDPGMGLGFDAPGAGFAPH